MPFTDKQIKLFKAAAADKEFAEKVGINQTTAKKLLKESKVKKYENGGEIEKKKKVIKPKDEKARIKEMAREDRYKKIRERDMKLFGPTEEPKPTKKPMKSMDQIDGVGLVPERRPMSRNMLEEMKKAGGKIGKGMTKNNYKKGGKVYCKDGCAVRGKTKGKLY